MTIPYAKWLSGHGAWRGASEWLWYFHGRSLQDEADLRMWYSWGSTDLRPEFRKSSTFHSYMYIYIFIFTEYILKSADNSQLYTTQLIEYTRLSP